MFDSVSVVIPAYNEEKVLGDTLGKVTSYCVNRFRDYEVVVVDDCSKDKTLLVAQAFASPKVKILRNERNRGKGYSVRRGILESKHPLVLFMDADSSLPIENLEVFVPYIEKGFDVVVASRNVAGARILNERGQRKFFSRVFSFIVRLLVLPGFSDTQCGFKLFRSEAAKKIVSLQTLERFSFDVELLFIAKKKGYRVVEAPVKCIYRDRSSVNPFRDGLNMLCDIVRIRLNDLLGRYN